VTLSIILIIVRLGVKAQMSYVHIMEHTTFVSLQFSQQQVLWTQYTKQPHGGVSGSGSATDELKHYGSHPRS